MSNLNPGGLTRVLNYIKTWVTGLLNGKANSSHTHNKSQITDFPAFGTTAGTICQGNDSRLSDARTPTSHTHTKSQITDFPTIPSSTSQLTNDSGYITSSGSCNYANSAGSAGSATTAETVSTSVAADSSKALVYSSMADNDFCRILVGGSSNAGYVEIATADDGNEPIYVRQYTGVFSTVTRTLTLLDGSGNTSFPGTVTASTFSGNLTGNCSGSCNYANSAGSVAWDNVSGKPSAFTPYFANGTWYAVGDDVAIGDHNVGGGLGVKALNSTTTRIDLCYKDDAANYKSITYDGTTLYVNGNCDYANSAGYTNWLRTSSHTDHLFHTEWDGSYFWTYVTAGDGGYRAVRVERSNSSGYADSCAETAYMGQYDTITYGVNRLQYYNTPTSATSGAGNIANPYNDWFYHLLMSHGNGSGYYGDIALCFHSNTLAFRRIVSGGDQGWTYLVKNGRTIISGYEVYVG